MKVCEKTRTTLRETNHGNFSHPFFDGQFWALEPVHLSWNNTISIFRSFMWKVGINFLKFSIGIIGAWTKRINRIMATLNIRKMLCRFYALYISCIIYIYIYMCKLYWHHLFSQGSFTLSQKILAKTHQLLMCAEKTCYARNESCWT